MYRYALFTVYVSFINKWTYVRLDNVFNEIILRTEDDVVNRNRFLIYDNIIKEKINNNSENTTRFIIISKKIESDSECNKISVVFSMEHKAGTLYELVRHLAENQINMIKIESRPMESGVWKYFLYVDFEGNLGDVKVQKALKSINEKSSYFKLLGGYLGNS